MTGFEIAGKVLESRLFVGTGKYGDDRIISDVVHASGSQVVTVALRRAEGGLNKGSILDCIPEGTILLPNTSGARNAEEAVRLARLGRAMGCGDWVKIEIITDTKYLMPDNFETLLATRILAEEGFKVFPYMVPDLIAGRKMVEAGAVAIMPLGSPIGSNRGIRTAEIIKIMIQEINVPIIIDAGIGRPSDAAMAMEMGASAVLVNTAIAISDNPVLIARAFSLAVEAGRIAYEVGFASPLIGASASSPLAGIPLEEA